MTNLFVLIVVVLFSFKAFSAEEASNTQKDSTELKQSLQQKQIRIIKASLDSENLPKTKIILRKSL